MPVLRCPFGASLFDKEQESSRKNLLFSLTDEVAAFVQTLDRLLLKCAAAKSQELFGTKLSPDAVEALYTPLLRPSNGDYQPCFRTKVNLSGFRTVRCFEPDLTPRPVPEDWRCEVQPAVALTHIWFQNKSWGAIVETTHAIIHEADDSCPFALE